MAFADLRDLPLADFIERFRAPDALWFFDHIPKTAGSSLSNELARTRPPYKNVRVDYGDPETPHIEKMRRAAHDFLSQQQKDGTYRSASGHVILPNMTMLREGLPGMRSFTFLRNPADRVISEFRYQRTEMHPTHEQFIEEFPTITDYVRDPRSQNKMLRFIGGDPGKRDPAQVIETVLRRFDFIGTLEMYPMSFNCVFALMGEPGKVPRAHERKTPDTDVTRVERSPELLAEIRTVNQLDMQLYRTVRDILRPRREEWLASGKGKKAADQTAD